MRTILSDLSSWKGSIIASIKTRIPPDHAHIRGFSVSRSLRYWTEYFFRESLAESDRATKLSVRNFGKFNGDI